MKYTLYRHCTDDGKGHYTVALWNENGQVWIGLDAIKKMAHIMEYEIIDEQVEFTSYGF